MENQYVSLLLELEYIEEVWKDKIPLLHSDPCERAQARFWADYINKKLFDLGKKIWSTKGEEQEAAKNDFIECLKVWLYAYETYGNFNIEAECPKFVAWAKRCMQRDSVAKSLPDQHKVCEFVSVARQKFGIE
ncbi:hypothetical protein RDI58_018781 [Solanum bulbocastanum]|uniref:Glutathione S-transferase n=1 Tax=Solanum bulbocastanum TaxID=147425 RepID=A0AAN8TH64_SOLBU